MGRCGISVTAFVHFTNTQRWRFAPLRRLGQMKCCILEYFFSLCFNVSYALEVTQV